MPVLGMYTDKQGITDKQMLHIAFNLMDQLTSYIQQIGVDRLLELSSAESILWKDILHSFGPAGLLARRAVAANDNVLTSSMFDGYGAQTSTLASADPFNGYGAQYGYYKDSETGLSLLGQRYYDGSQDRFLSWHRLNKQSELPEMVIEGEYLDCLFLLRQNKTRTVRKREVLIVIPGENVQCRAPCGGVHA